MLVHATASTTWLLGSGVKNCNKIFSVCHSLANAFHGLQPSLILAQQVGPSTTEQAANRKVPYRTVPYCNLLDAIRPRRR